MAKLEEGERESSLPLIEPTPQRQNGKANGHRSWHESPETPPKAQFDLMNYLLNPVPAEVRGDSGPLREVPRQMPRTTVSEVELDMKRVDPHLVILSEYDPAAAEQYQRIASSLIAAAADRPLKRVLIASALQGDGRTCVLLNLAGALVQAHRRVLVIDTDLKHPSVSRLLGMEAGPGLTEVHAGDIPTNAALRRVQPGGFDILPTRTRPENTAELLASPDFGRLLDDLDHEYDFILFDSAPLLVADDAYLLLRLVDTALVVVAQNRCSTAQATRAVAKIAQEDIFGVVLNRLMN
jgi:capsular exopolysaccharide synthesis family protein